MVKISNLDPEDVSRTLVAAIDKYIGRRLGPNERRKMDSLITEAIAVLIAHECEIISNVTGIKRRRLGRQRNPRVKEVS